MIDNNFTPYIVVDAGVQGVQVPQDFVSDGQIILNISPSAVRGLIVSNDAIDFNARFGGVPMRVYVPIVAVLAIYARENGQGMVFGAEPGAPQPDDEPPLKPVDSVDEAEEPAVKAKPSLKVVK
jgi:stringent starvation protein B